MWVLNLVDGGQGGNINLDLNAWASTLGLGSRVGSDHFQQRYVSSASALWDGLELGRLAVMEGMYLLSFGKRVWVTLNGSMYCNKFILLKWWHHHSLQWCKAKFKQLCNPVLVLEMFMFISLSTVFSFTMSISWLALFFIALWGFTISV